VDGFQSSQEHEHIWLAQVSTPPFQVSKPALTFGAEFPVFFHAKQNRPLVFARVAA